MLGPGYGTAHGGWKVSNENISFCEYEDINRLDDLKNEKIYIHF